MQGNKIVGVYHPRRPKESPLWHLLDRHFHDFEQDYVDKFVRNHGFYRRVVSDVVEGYLRCGNLQDGFARVRCPDCHHEYLLAFSCRGRWFCPSCHTKKVVQFGQHLRDNILYPIPHRQYVFSIPIILRTYFKYDRKLLGKLCLCINKSLLEFFRTATGLKDGCLGAVMAIQTFGDYARWHPHIHVLLADGLFRKNGVFYVMPKIDIIPLAELFRANVLKMLKKEGRIDDALIRKIMAWRYNSGFSVHNGTRLARGDEAGKEALAQYIIRNPFAVKKITYNDTTGTVIYKAELSSWPALTKLMPFGCKSKMLHRKSKGGKKNFQVFTAQEFIAAITQHIPDKSFQLVRYYGWYSNRGRGDREKLKQCEGEKLQEGITATEIIDISEYRPRKIPSPKWRECIKKVWEVDPLLCPKCGGEMRIISFITENDVIRKILDHLGLWEERAPVERAPPTVIRERQYEPYDDGWQKYEESTTPVH